MLAQSSTLLALVVLGSPSAALQSESGDSHPEVTENPATTGQESKTSIFRDPTDGAFDMTAWLIQQRGVIPVPMIITEPALGGFGLGAGLVFLHGTRDQVEDPWTTDMEGERVLPPSVSVLFGGYTANDTWFAGGGHFSSWKDDSIRYMGAGGFASVNLDYYVGGAGFAYNIEGLFVIQDILFRIADTPLFLGSRYTITSNQVDAREGGSGIAAAELDSQNAAFAAQALFDTRDSIFSPSKGTQAQAFANFFDQSFGGDFDYVEGRLDLQHWEPLGEKFVFGARALGAVVGDGAPFYGQPFIELRGVPMMRYQGNQMYTFDTELRYDITPRWSTVGFLGIGGAYSDSALRPDYDDVIAGGAGFRYLIGRPIGARAGIDIGVGPEGPALYIQFGSAW